MMIKEANITVIVKDLDKSVLLYNSSDYKLRKGGIHYGAPKNRK
jgi:hypothetical protein